MFTNLEGGVVLIEVKNLVKRYNDRVAVDDLSFTLEKGHVLGFLGPNGAGKSTTMNIITGYLEATSGTVKINGHNIEEEPALAKRSIGYLPEIPPLYLDMKVKEYLKFVAELKGVKIGERKKMIEEIIDLIGLQEVQGRLIAHLSKGFKQRVGLAGAIMGYPDLIILDEPTVGLDPKQVIEIRELIRKLSEKHTIILSSHILSEISAVCDEIMIINKGKLVVRDTPENLTKQAEGGNGLILKVKGTKEAVEEVINSIAGIESVSFAEESENTEAGVINLTVTYKDNEEIRDDISMAFAQARCPIYEMKAISMSLEDIFLEVTKGQAPLPIDELLQDVEDEEVEDEEVEDEEVEEDATDDKEGE